jgi:uncharacterized repeat protein (TIGR02543 family)
MLVGHWKLDEESGVRLDSSGRFNTLSEVTAVGFAPGRIGNAADSDGTNYLRIDDADQNGLDVAGSLTVAAWIKPAEILSTHQVILGKYDYSIGQRAYRMELKDGRLGVWLSPDGGYRDPRYGGTVLEAGEWYHVAVVFSTSAAKVRFYVNGILDGEADSWCSSLHNSTAPFALGCNFSGGTPESFFRGLIDDARVYARALSSGDIAALAAMSSPPVLDPVGDKSVDEGETLSFTLTASDPNPGQTLTFGAEELPAGATLDPDTGEFSWTPSEAQGPGTYTVTFTVSDGMATDSETIHIDVAEVNNPPTIDSHLPADDPVVMQLGDTETFEVFASDPDAGDVLAYAWKADGVTVDGQTASSMAYTPATAGSHTVTVTVSDGNGGEASHTWNVTVNAPPQYTLTVNTVGTGSGSVTLDPPGGTYDEGTIVTLTASADAGSTFEGWSGAASGTANPVTVTMDGDKTVTATFDLIPPPQYTLTVNTDGAGSGSVTLDPPGGTYDEGTVVTLTASPDAGSTFEGWSGAATGTANPVTVTMDGDRTVTATFKANGPGDLNGDGVVNIDDLTLVTSHFGQTSADPGWDPLADANGDGLVNIDDLTAVISNYGRSY